MILQLHKLHVERSKGQYPVNQIISHHTMANPAF